MFQRAGVAELVYARDSKSRVLVACGFESHLRHHWLLVVSIPLVTAAARLGAEQARKVSAYRRLLRRSRA